MPGPKPSPKPVEDASPAESPTPSLKASRRDTLHVAFHGMAQDITDVVVFGTRPEALEHAIEQTPPWKVISLLKGQSLNEAISEKEKS